MDLQLGRAIGIVTQTMPYILYRALVYGAFCLAFLVYLAVLGLIGWVFGGAAAVILFVLTMAGGALLGLGRLLGQYVLYLLSAGHVALITEIVENGSLPPGISQTAWAKERVLQFFKEVSVLAVVDQLLKGIIRMVNRRLLNVMTILPVPGMEGAAKAAQKVVDFSLTYVDEAIIAYTIKTRNENVYDAAKTAVLLYAQSWRSVLKNAVALTLLSYVFAFVCALVFLAPLGAIALMLPEGWDMTRLALFVFALFLGMSAKWILFDPIACTSAILTFLKACETQTPDPEWELRIASVSDKFTELKQKAIEKARELGQSGGEPPPGGPAASEPDPAAPGAPPADQE